MTATRDIVGFVYHDHIPTGTFQKVAVAATVFQGSIEIDDALINLERIFRRRREKLACQPK